MKRTIILLVLFTNTFVSFSQTKTDSISVTFPKVLIINEKKEIMLSFDDNRKAYEVPSIGVINGPISFKSYIDTMAKEIGINYKSFRLGGIFTYIFPDKYRTFIRPYFVVQFSSYSNKQHSLDTSYKWFSLTNTLKKIKYPASVKIVERIIKSPGNVWAATFKEYGYTNPVDTSKIKFRIVEDFSRLN